MDLRGRIQPAFGAENVGVGAKYAAVTMHNERVRGHFDSLWKPGFVDDDAAAGNVAREEHGYGGRKAQGFVHASHEEWHLGRFVVTNGKAQFGFALERIDLGQELGIYGGVLEDMVHECADERRGCVLSADGEDEALMLRIFAAHDCPIDVAGLTKTEHAWIRSNREREGRSCKYLSKTLPGWAN